MKTIWIAIPLIIAGAVWYFLGFPGLPTPTTEIVAVTSVPTSAIVRESFNITWQVDNPQSITITHTAIHYGPQSKEDISYPDFTEDFVVSKEYQISEHKGLKYQWVDFVRKT